MIPVESDKYPAFGKIPRLNREFWITEKIDGTNGLIQIRELEPTDRMLDASGYRHEVGETVVLPSSPDGTAFGVRAGSRKRWLTIYEDNFDFAAWVAGNAISLVEDLGPGRHYGEYYGRGIQRGYGLDGRRFALFNARRWQDVPFTTPYLESVPVVSVGDHNIGFEVHLAVEALREFGSLAVEGWPKAEGVVVYHVDADQAFKVTLVKDEAPKALQTKGALQQVADVETRKAGLSLPGDDDFPIVGI